MSKKNVTAIARPMAAPLIDIGIKGKDREKIVQGLSRVLAEGNPQSERHFPSGIHRSPKGVCYLFQRL